MAKNSKQVTEQANEVKEIKEIKENVTETQEIAKVQENQVDESQAPMEEVKADTSAAQEDKADEADEADEAVINAPGEELYKKHVAAVKDAKQFYQCKLPSMSYYSKRALCEAVDNMKRMNDRTKGMESLNTCIEMLEVAVAYLYNRKIND